jgi:putative transposase
LVSAERASHVVATLCRVLGVSVSGFYAWLRAIPVLQTRAEAEAELRGQIDRIFAARGRSTARPGSMPSCAGRAGGTRAGASRG